MPYQTTIYILTIKLSFFGISLCERIIRTSLKHTHVQTDDSTGSGTVPSFGPRRANTYVVVYGVNFDLAGGVDGLLCLIGDDWSVATEVRMCVCMYVFARMYIH